MLQLGCQLDGSSKMTPIWQEGSQGSGKRCRKGTEIDQPSCLLEKGRTRGGGGQEGEGVKRKKKKEEKKRRRRKEKEKEEEENLDP